MAIFEVTPSPTPNMPISVAGWLFRRSPILLRRGAQAAAFYFATLAAEKAFDAAHEAFPENQFIGKGDTVMRKTVKVENLMLSGVGSIAIAAYQAIPAAKAAPAALPELTPASNLLNIGGNDVALQTRQAAFQPIPKQRRRMTLNTQLNNGVADHCSMTALTLKEDRPDPETERLNGAELARHQLSTIKKGSGKTLVNSGYDSATCVIWGGYAQSSASAQPVIVEALPEAMVIVEPAPIYEQESMQFRDHNHHVLDRRNEAFSRRPSNTFHIAPGLRR